MPVSDLSLVTATLLNLLKLRVDVLWSAFFSSPAPPIAYSAVSSNALAGDNTLGMFLFHANEDAHFKNMPPLFQDQPPVRFTPMGLQLQYQMVAHAAATGGDAESAAQRAQLLFGLGLKTLHDFPSLDRNTRVDGNLVFPVALQGTDNIIRIAFRNVTPSEATSFWTAATQGVRLAAYYEVTATLLEPDRPQLRGARVLRYGVQIFVNGAPRLDTSRSRITFKLPLEASDRTVDLEPGEAATGETIHFDGSDLSGDATTLLLKKAGWLEPEEVGFDWSVTAGTDTIAATVRPRAGAHAIVPGVYSAAARVTRKRTMPDGSIRAFPQTSNDVPFTVAPRITNPAYNVVPPAANVVTVTGGIFQHAEVPPESVRLIVGAEAVPIQPSGALTAGHFEIPDPATLRFQFPIGALNSGDVVPMRIIVNGAESAPRWVRVP
jgi:hypothetical protein